MISEADSNAREASRGEPPASCAIPSLSSALRSAGAVRERSRLGGQLHRGAGPTERQLDMAQALERLWSGSAPFIRRSQRAIDQRARLVRAALGELLVCLLEQLIGRPRIRLHQCRPLRAHAVRHQRRYQPERLAGGHEARLDQRIERPRHACGIELRESGRVRDGRRALGQCDRRAEGLGFGGKLCEDPGHERPHRAVRNRFEDLGRHAVGRLEAVDLRPGEQLGEQKRDPTGQLRALLAELARRLRQGLSDRLRARLA